MDRLEILERISTDTYVCGSFQSVSSYTNQDGFIITGSVVRGVSSFVVCQVENRIYHYSQLEEVTGVFADRDMIADFDREENQPWLIAYDPVYDLEFPYRLRRLYDRNPTNQIDYLFVTYLAENANAIDGVYGEEFVASPAGAFTTGIGFPVQGGLTLRGYLLNGQLTGDTTTVYATSIEYDPEFQDGPALLSNYPNPFNPSTEIRWTMDVGRDTRLSVYDLLGREVAVLVNERMPAGQHSVTFDASGLPSGMYVIVLETEAGRDVRKVSLVK
jgi:hypothetical protein